MVIKGRTKASVVGLAVFFMLGLVSSGFAQEHPSEHPSEHPKEQSKEQSKEHPKEHPKDKKGSDTKHAGVTKEQLAEAIEEYVKKDAALHGGYFLVFDSVAGKPLALSLAKVHKKRLSKVGKDLYFACADFETRDGRVYDLDIFMKGPDKAGLEVTEISVHKEQGKERYNWVERKGLWHKKPVEGGSGTKRR